MNFTKAESDPKVYLRFRYLKHGSRIKKKKNFLARGRKEGVNVAIKLTTMCLGIKRRVCIKYLIISDISYRRYMLTCLKNWYPQDPTVISLTNLKTQIMNYANTNVKLALNRLWIKNLQKLDQSYKLRLQIVIFNVQKLNLQSWQSIFLRWQLTNNAFGKKYLVHPLAFQIFQTAWTTW